MPCVSVIVPCFNEEATIQLLLGALYRQTYPRQQMEVVIADGCSNDQTRERIEAFRQEHPDLQIRVVDNPRRIIPAGVNVALDAAQGEYVVRLDAHSMPRPDYVERCITALATGRGVLVGGVWDVQPGGKGWLPKSIAVAAAHPLGVGDARYRYTTEASAVDTVPFGAFHRSLIERIGRYDETLLTNEDYEFNTRVRQSGGTVWLDPAICSVYFARPNLAALARQYWRYGYWKLRMLKRYPHTLRWRQALPPLFVLSLILGGFLAIGFSFFRWLLMVELILYGLTLLAVGIQLARKKKDPALILGVPVSIAVMHISWGSAFLWSVLFS